MPEYIVLDNLDGSLYPTGVNLDSYIPFIRETTNTIKALILTKDFIKNENTLWLVVRGHSGSILGGAIASKLLEYYNNVKLIVCRKKEDCSHTTNDKFYYENNDAIVVIDDFIVTGDTLLNILDYITNCHKGISIDMLCVNSISDIHNTYVNTYLSYFKYVCTDKLSFKNLID